VVRDSLPKLAPNGPDGGTMAELERGHFGGSPLVSIVTWPMVVCARSRGDLLWLWACSPHLWALVLHSSGPSLLRLRRMVFALCSFAHSKSFMCISTNTLLQMVKHQNSWNSLVIISITKFGVHLSGFYVSVGGYF
jgi:hypothetical protein